ncbi:carboxypeptidase-like regulatory domain-containing protein [Chryseobacterium sp. MFBS3-17]|uniref:carboxypeptidase-like regulatory domain-containing protein n=1 Tax=Chryseobacterium sp. MFBS3-17 TaxID=2886689 RepID=UPI001D0E7ED8|nr:carboxypeptidase-like regulatory domain-containing protein [Chryseobacterium sp. MFBS3-17]MCC2591580.1 carboxypeptidase-like regulatory domain-containing protein [Chryseobacterium sp. MFBS3-17]
MNKKILLFVFQWVAISLNAQTLSGVVVDADQRKPISGVKVGIENTGIWTVTDQSGNFSIRYHANETVLFSRAGLLEERKTYTTPPASGISVEMQMASIRIKEVELSARKKNFSEIEIKEEALQKIQSFSLGDVLQQLPGQFIKPMAHTEMKNIVLRTATGETPFYSVPDAEDFGNKAFGTQLVINDIAVSNNGYTGRAGEETY